MGLSADIRAGPAGGGVRLSDSDSSRSSLSLPSDFPMRRFKMGSVNSNKDHFKKVMWTFVTVLQICHLMHESLEFRIFEFPSFLLKFLGKFPNSVLRSRHLSRPRIVGSLGRHSGLSSGAASRQEHASKEHLSFVL